MKKLFNLFCLLLSIFGAHTPLMQPSAKIFSGTSSQYLAEKIAQCFGNSLGRINIQKFSDGEFQPVFLESIRGDYVRTSPGLQLVVS